MENIESLKAENRQLRSQIEILKKNPFASLRQPKIELDAYKCQGIACRSAGQCARYDPFGTSLNCGAFWLRRDDVHSGLTSHQAKMTPDRAGLENGAI